MRSDAEFNRALELIAAGHGDRAIAERTRIPRRTINEWRSGRPCRDRRQRCTLGQCAQVDLSAIPPAEYAYVLGLYLGDGYISASHRGVWCLRITLDVAYPKIIEACRNALEAVFPEKTARIGRRSSARCVDVSMWSKHWPCVFPQHGPGRKHERPISLASWQERLLAGHRKSLLRGLIHSDGTRIIATERKGRYVRKATRYAFSNRSEDILRIFWESCDALGVRWTRASDRQIANYRLASVSTLDSFIGPKH